MSKFDSLSDLSIDVIWSIGDKTNFINAMYDWLCKKCEDGDQIEELSDAEKIFYMNTVLEVEVNNGGFSQYFFNSSGDFANETLHSLYAIGAVHTANIYTTVLKVVGGVLPKDRSERQDLLEELVTDIVEEQLNECDAAFYEYVDDLGELNYQYIMKNKEQFT